MSSAETDSPDPAVGTAVSVGVRAIVDDLAASVGSDSVSSGVSVGASVKVGRGVEVGVDGAGWLTVGPGLKAGAAQPARRATTVIAVSVRANIDAAYIRSPQPLRRAMGT
jgi:hypothetical protein